MRYVSSNLFFNEKIKSIIPIDINKIDKSIIYPFQNCHQISCNLDEISCICEYGLFDMSISSLAIPSNVQFLGQRSLAQNLDLTSIVFDNNSNISSIEEATFHRCIKLKECILPPKLKIIKSEAFKECLDLNNINIPSSVNYIGNNVFSRCISMSNINLPNELISIEPSSFDQCYNLLSIDIPSKVKTIGAEAFYLCKNLSYVNINSEITHLDKSAFVGCNKLQNITYNYDNTDIFKYVKYMNPNLMIDRKF